LKKNEVLKNDMNCGKQLYLAETHQPSP